MKKAPLLSFVLLAFTSPAQGQSTVLPSPFSPTADVAGGSEGVLDLESSPVLAAELRAAYAADRSVLLVDFALPEGELVSLSLRPVSAFAQGAHAIVIGEGGVQQRLAPSIATFSGHVVGDGGPAFLGLSTSMAHGYLTVGGELFILSSGPADGSGALTLARANAVGGSALTDVFCRASAAVAPPGGEEHQAGAGGPVVRIADIFIELDHEFDGLFSTDQESIDYATLLLSASGSIYRRDIGAVLRIPDGYMRLWTTVPPWGVITTFGDISNVQAWWTSGANPDKDIHRASVHVFTTPVFGGVAWAIGGLCSHEAGYEISSVFGSFPYPIEHTDAGNWDMLVVNHEYGHTFGSPHTFNYVPEIVCTDGSGPDEGTLMGYCHANGMETVGMRFHARVQERMRTYLETSTDCLEWLPIDLGDYDFDGVVEADDLATLDACLVQGFHSEGCLETFDFDGDGELTTCDRAIMAELVEGPGSISCVDPDACPCGNDGGCAGCANSTGSGSTILGTGSTSVGADDLVLTASGLPTGQNAIFFSGMGTGQLPLGDGLRCVTGQTFRFAVINTGSGTADLGPGIVAYTLANFAPSGQIAAGETWGFQLWHRDPNGPCGQTSNLGSSYQVSFTP